MTPRPRSARSLLPALLAALTTALVVPVATTGPTSAEPAPRPVKASMRQVAVTEVAGTGGQREGRTSTVELRGGVHVLGVSWAERDGRDVGTVEVRERSASGGWGPWSPMASDGDDGPDAAGSSARGGTEAFVTTASAVQVRVVGARGAGRVPPARLDVVDPGTSAADAAPVTAGAAAAGGTKPTIYSRAQWGADESIRTWAPSYGTIKAAVVHHTAGSNSYSAGDVPAIIRGIYVFHTQGRGWGDIGYNFLVDKFGRIWEGRYGGVDKPTVGAHAGGFNSQTFGSSTIGDYSTTPPPAAVLTAQSKLIAWKLGLAHVDPTRTTSIEGAGTRNTVMGHRDLNDTGCPGAQLYASLPTLRSRAKDYQGTMFYEPSISTSQITYGGGTVTVRARPSTGLAWTLTATSVCRSTPQFTRTGTATVASGITATWTGRDTGGTPVPPGDYFVTLTAHSGTGTLASVPPATFRVTVGAVPGAPEGYCPPRLSGQDRYGTAVAVARATSWSSTTVVIASGVETAMPDALVAAPLAAARDGVLLLSGPQGLTATTRSEISRRAATTALVVGGTGAVPAGVEADLRSLGVTTVTRVAGPDRFATAVAVARAMGSHHPDVMLASGMDGAMADGLLLSGPAAALGRPILLVGADRVPTATRTALTEFGTTATVVAGGPGVVSDRALAALPSPTRLAGSNRYGTGTAIGSWAVSRVPVGSVTLAPGEDAALVDSLSGGQLGHITMPTRSAFLPDGIRSWLAGTPGIGTVVVVGGAAVVTDEVAGAAADAVR
jgi:putative cell wall-binding protein